MATPSEMEMSPFLLSGIVARAREAPARKSNNNTRRGKKRQNMPLMIDPLVREKSKPTGTMGCKGRAGRRHVRECSTWRSGRGRVRGRPDKLSKYEQTGRQLCRFGVRPCSSFHADGQVAVDCRPRKRAVLEGCSRPLLRYHLYSSPFPTVLSMKTSGRRHRHELTADH